MEGQNRVLEKRVMAKTEVVQYRERLWRAAVEKSEVECIENKFKQRKMKQIYTCVHTIFLTAETT